MRIDDLEIFPVFDTPHLLKGIRNNLWSKHLALDVKKGGQSTGEMMIAKWDTFVVATMIDKYSGNVRKMPKIKDDHLQPVGMKKMKVSIAAQTLSNSVAKFLEELSEKPGKS